MVKSRLSSLTCCTSSLPVPSWPAGKTSKRRRPLLFCASTLAASSAPSDIGWSIVYWCPRRHGLACCARRAGEAVSATPARVAPSRRRRVVVDCFVMSCLLLFTFLIALAVPLKAFCHPEHSDHAGVIHAYRLLRKHTRATNTVGLVAKFFDGFECCVAGHGSQVILRLSL